MSRVLLALLVLACLTCCFLPAQAVLDLSRLQPGQVGYGKTVFSGTQIERFPITVIDIIQADDPEDDLILVKVGGKRLDALGGVAAGMSGSPIYVNDELVGALAYVLPQGDPHYAYVTPAHLMLQLAERPFARALPPSGLRPVRSPLCLSGLSHHAFSASASLLRRAGLVPVQAPASVPARANDTPRLEPGAAIAVSLMSGDSQAVSLGTLTWLKGDTALLMGHSLYQEGRTRFPFALGYILATVPGSDGPFKLGGALENEGEVLLDSPWALLARIGTTCPGLQVQVAASEPSLHRRKLLHFDVVPGRSYTSALLSTALLDSLDKVRNKIGPGACRLTLDAALSDGRNLHAAFDFSTLGDLSSDCANFLSPLLEGLFAFEETRQLVSLDFQVEVSPPRPVYSLRQLRLVGSAPALAPGSRLQLAFDAFRCGRPLHSRFEYNLARNRLPGQYVIVLTGGQALQPEQWLARGRRLAFAAASQARDAADYLALVAQLADCKTAYLELLTPAEFALRLQGVGTPGEASSDAADQSADTSHLPWQPALPPGPGEFTRVSLQAPLLGVAGLPINLVEAPVK